MCRAQAAPPLGERTTAMRPLRIGAVELMDVFARASEKTITWDSVAPPIPLGAYR